MFVRKSNKNINMKRFPIILYKFRGSVNFLYKFDS